MSCEKTKSCEDNVKDNVKFFENNVDYAPIDTFINCYLETIKQNEYKVTTGFAERKLRLTSKELFTYTMKDSSNLELDKMIKEDPYFVKNKSEQISDVLQGFCNYYNVNKNKDIFKVIKDCYIISDDINIHIVNPNATHLRRESSSFGTSLTSTKEEKNIFYSLIIYINETDSLLYKIVKSFNDRNLAVGFMSSLSFVAGMMYYKKYLAK